MVTLLPDTFLTSHAWHRICLEIHLLTITALTFEDLSLPARNPLPTFSQGKTQNSIDIWNKLATDLKITNQHHFRVNFTSNQFQSSRFVPFIECRTDRFATLSTASSFITSSCIPCRIFSLENVGTTMETNDEFSSFVCGHPKTGGDNIFRSKLTSFFNLFFYSL